MIFKKRSKICFIIALFRGSRALFTIRQDETPECLHLDGFRLIIMNAARILIVNDLENCSCLPQLYHDDDFGTFQERLFQQCFYHNQFQITFMVFNFTHFIDT